MPDGILPLLYVRAWKYHDSELKPACGIIIAFLMWRSPESGWVTVETFGIHTVSVLTHECEGCVLNTKR